ncbi:MAG: hypothetical protein PVG39_05525 [Desulfobacteraceae bacterium]|jgi:hypothetical protein
MKKVKSNIIRFIKLSILAAVLLLGAEPTAKEKEKPQYDVEARDKASVDTKGSQTKKDKEKETKTFKPTEEVSADQAVAFPIDI